MAKAASKECEAKPSAAKRDSVFGPTSKVEIRALERSGYDFIYRPEEKIPSIIVENFPALGQLAAVRFLEWALENPEGVVSLPTGKTPEYFIKYVQSFLNNWSRKSTRAILEEMGLVAESKPALAGLRFVQIDEFYPIDSQQHNSFFHFIKKYYMKGFGLDPARALLIDPGRIGLPPGVSQTDVFPEMTVDLSLRVRKAKSLLEKQQQQVLQQVDQFCTEYERKIREMGGLGFFLGGIGPDGHVGFNIKGSDFYSTTRLIDANYETKAAAATDLGGMEVARNKRLITIGLRTITHNPNTVAIIIAAGEAKADIVARTIHSERSNQYPGSVLAELPNARLFLTRGAAQRLSNRTFVDFQRCPDVPLERTCRIVMDLSLTTGKPIRSLNKADFEGDRFGKELLKRTGLTAEQLRGQAESVVLESLRRGNRIIEDKVFLHTAPHHDDIILGYLPFVTNLVRRSSTRHYFAYMTSGFTAVTNLHMHGVIGDLLAFLERGEFNALLKTDYFEPCNTAAARIDTSFYLEGEARHHDDKKRAATSRRLLRNMIELYEDDSIENIRQRCTELQNYFATQYPGKKDMAIVQQLKGRVREWESDLKWAYFGFTGDTVRHLRLGFYKGDVFSEAPQIDRDVPPIVQLLHEVNPHTVTVAFDPEGSGPDTHYKVLQAVSQARSPAAMM